MLTLSHARQYVIMEKKLYTTIINKEDRKRIKLQFILEKKIQQMSCVYSWLKKKNKTVCTDAWFSANNWTHTVINYNTIEKNIIFWTYSKNILNVNTGMISNTIISRKKYNHFNVQKL